MRRAQRLDAGRQLGGGGVPAFVAGPQPYMRERRVMQRRRAAMRDRIADHAGEEDLVGIRFRSHQHRRSLVYSVERDRNEWMGFWRGPQAPKTLLLEPATEDGLSHGLGHVSSSCSNFKNSWFVVVNLCVPGLSQAATKYR